MKHSIVRSILAGVMALTMAFPMAASAGETEAATEAAAQGAGKALNICILTTSGVDDGSFNENCYDGIQSFLKTHPDSKVTDVKEPDFSKLASTLEGLVGDYDVFVLPGFNFAAAAGEMAKANPDKYFLVVDSTVTDADGNALAAADLGNVYTMTFQEEQSGFFAGLAAALSSKSGKVAVINGIAFPSNVNYQLGFMSGVSYSNAKYGTKAECVELPSYAGTATVPVKGMPDDGANVGGNYVGAFDDEATGKQVANALLEKGCDVLFPAAGASGNGVFAAVKENGSAYAIGCDVDQYDDGKNGDKNFILTSALKVMDVNVERQLTALSDGTFKAEDAVLGADTDSTGFTSEEGRNQLSEDTLAKMNETYELVKDGTIVPASNFNGYLPDDFPGLK